MKTQFVPPGNYVVGDDRVPNASPKHVRSLQRPLWVLETPFTWQMFEDNLQTVPMRIQQLPEEARRFCRDSSVERLLEASIAMESLPNWSKIPGREFPVTGLTWQASRSFASVFGGRLPTEIEWEIFVRREIPTKLTVNTSQNIPLQEWTLDAFAPKYWRADFSKSGVPWVEGSGKEVTVRGFDSNDLHRHPCYRRGANPQEPHPQRGFRIAWDQDPTLFLKTGLERS